MIRHLEARTPHFQQTQAELMAMAANPGSDIPFTHDEREHYAILRREPDLAKRLLNTMASTTSWSKESFSGCGISVLRSPIPLRTSSVPAIAIRSPDHPTLAQPLPGMVPYQLIAAINPSTLVSLVLGSFEDGFANMEIDESVARGYNRHLLGHFAFFGGVRHLVTGREGLVDEMAWVGYRVLTETAKKAVFYRD